MFKIFELIIKEHKSEVMESIKNGDIDKLIGVSPDDLELK